MLASEATLIKNVIAVIRAAVSTTLNKRIELPITLTKWSTDVDAATTNVEAHLKTGQSFKAVPVVTVANLPSTPATNDEAIVTDATVTTNASIVAGGGANRVLVSYNGTNWLIV